MKRAELLQSLLELAESLNEKSDSITELFGADEIEFLDDEEKMILNMIFRVADVTGEGHRIQLEDRFYDFLFGRIDTETLIDEILSIHEDVDADYRAVNLFDDELLSDEET